MESNYALYREQAKKMNPNMDEKDIYANWHELAFGKWSVQGSPVVGYDGNYHYLYLSERDDGKIYIGRHSTTNLDDGYVGSTRFLHRMRLLPDPGDHTVTVVDADGNSLSINFTIEKGDR